MKHGILSLALFLSAAATFGSCSNAEINETDAHAEQLHTSLITYELQAARHMFDLQNGLNYERAEKLHADSLITTSQIDSLRRFHNSMRRYRNALYVLRRDVIALAEGIPDSEADTLHVMLLRNPDAVVVVPQDAVDQLRLMTDSLYTWYKNVPYCDTNSNAVKGPGQVYDYPDYTTFYSWTEVGFTGRSVEDVLMTINALFMRSDALECTATSSFINGATRNYTFDK